MIIGHPARPLRNAHEDGGALPESVHGSVTSTVDFGSSEDRNFPSSLDAVFAPYQPIGHTRDLTNPFQRTNMSISIRRYIDKLEGRLASLECQLHEGRLSDDEYLELADEALGRLRRHRYALFRLNELGRN